MLTKDVIPVLRMRENFLIHSLGKYKDFLILAWYSIVTSSNISTGVPSWELCYLENLHCSVEWMIAVEVFDSV